MMSVVFPLIVIAVVLGIVLNLAAVLVWVERRLLAVWQDRYGPNRVGPFGLLHAPMPFPQPWFDQHGWLYPAFHVMRGLAALAGSSLIEVAVSAPRNLQAVAVRREGGGLELWLANLTGDRQQFSLDPALASGRIAVLDAQGFVSAEQSADAMESFETSLSAAEIELDAYAVARIRSP